MNRTRKAVLESPITEKVSIATFGMSPAVERWCLTDSKTVLLEYRPDLMLREAEGILERDLPSVTFYDATADEIAQASWQPGQKPKVERKYS